MTKGKKRFKVQSKLKINFHQDFNKFYDHLKYLRQSGRLHFEEGPFSESAEGIDMKMYEDLLLVKGLQTALSRIRKKI